MPRQHTPCKQWLLITIRTSVGTCQWLWRHGSMPGRNLYINCESEAIRNKDQTSVRYDQVLLYVLSHARKREISVNLRYDFRWLKVGIWQYHLLNTRANCDLVGFSVLKGLSIKSEIPQGFKNALCFDSFSDDIKARFHTSHDVFSPMRLVIKTLLLLLQPRVCQIFLNYCSPPDKKFAHPLYIQKRIFRLL